MNYIYDILLNFNDSENYFEFYEWKEDDCFEHIKRIPLIRISKETMQNFLSCKIKVSSELLNFLKGNTISYKNKKDIKAYELIQNVDKIFVVDSGKIIEQGQHKNLVVLDGVYKKLWKMEVCDEI